MDEGTQYTERQRAEDEGRTLDVLKYDAKVEKDYVPEGFATVEEYLEDVRQTHAHDMEADDDNRQEALDDNRFAAGDQWDDKVLEHRTGLPNLVINSIPQFTAQIVGDWRENRRSVRVLPSEDGDVNAAEVRGDLIRAIEQKSRANRVYNDAFESTVTCGDGAFRVCVEYASDDVFEQEIMVRPISDCLSVIWDRMSVDPTGKDARHCFVDDRIPKSEFRQKWPEHAETALDSTIWNEVNASGWFDDHTYKITEHWRIIERDRLLGMFEDGSVHEINDDTMEELLLKKGSPVRTRLAPIKFAQMHLVTGHAILGGPYEYRLNRLPIIRMVGRTKMIEGQNIRYGIVRWMKDPARLRNFWRSAIAEQLGYAPKAQWMVTESAVEGKEDDLRRAHLSRDPIMKFNDEAVFGQNVVRMDPPAPQLALMQEAAANTQDMKDVTGIHDASLGIRSNEVSGKAINARQREGDVAAMTYFDNGDEAILEAGDVINQLINTVYDSQRIIRVLGEDQSEKFVTINDPHDPDSPNLSAGKYDLTLSTGTSYSTRRVEAAEAMLNAIQVAPELMGIAGDLIVKAQDWPGAQELSERLKKTIPMQLLTEEEREEVGQVIPPEVQQQIQEMQAALQQAGEEIKGLKADKTIELLGIQVDAYNGETQRIRALSDHEVDNQKVSLQAIDNIIKNEISIEEIRQKADTAAQGLKQPASEPKES